jgi:hypothetical protein
MKVCFSIKYAFGTFNSLFPALGIEWCKARARAYRWAEECVLLQEEMRRVLEFYGAMQRLWEQRADHYLLMPMSETSSSRKATVGGGIVYARRQADQCIRMSRVCLKAWKNVPNMYAQSQSEVRDIEVGWRQLPQWVQRAQRND